jgi:hypothetical protein
MIAFNYSMHPVHPCDTVSHPEAGSPRVRPRIKLWKGWFGEKSIRQVAAHGSPRSLEMRQAVEAEFGSLPRLWMKAP